jgi:hypothetical protein
MTLDETFRTILRDTVKTKVKNMDLLDILLHAVVIRTHSIALREDVELEDVWQKSGKRVVLAAITQRHAAKLLASLWPPTKQRGQDAYWYHRYNQDTPYEIFESVPPELRERALAAKKSIEEHPLVAELIPE